MTESELQEGLHALLDEALAVVLGEIGEDGMTLPSEFENLIRIESFADAGVLTSDSGLVIRFKGGEQFHITLVKSR